MINKEKKRNSILNENVSLKRTVEELSILSDFAAAVAGTLDLNKILNAIIHRSLTTFRATQGVITLVNNNDNDPSKTFIRIAVSSNDRTMFHFNEGLLGWMLLHKKPLLINDPPNDPRFHRIHWDEPVSSLLCAPMLVKGNLIGVLTIYKTKGNPFTDEDQRLMAIIAIQMAQVVENARIEEEKRLMQSTIARDLHDDVASSLSSIALYAEQLKRQLGTVPHDAMTTIETMSTLSLEAVEAMGDIVWAIAPEHDSLDELLLRLKLLTIEACNAKEIRHHIKLPENHHERVLDTDDRRNLYLIFKEALNNIIKHSQANSVEIALDVQNSIFSMMIHDNGIGFSHNNGTAITVSTSGHGLRNMQKRAQEINAQLTISSDIGRGTTISLTKKMT